MKIHRPLAQAVSESLIDIFSGGFYADKVVERNLKTRKKWGSRDRRFYAETVYDIVRYWRRLLCFCGENYAVVELTPALAAKIIDTYFSVKLAPPEELEAKLKKLSRAERESIPDWLDERGVAECGEKWGELLAALNQPAPQFLRVNTLKINRKELIAKLQAEEVETEAVDGVPTALRLVRRQNVFQTQAYKSGLFEMQDAGSQLIAPLLKAQPEERVADACAGAGGKTLHLAAIMENRGRIIAMDVHDKKLQELKVRARRAGLTLVETRLIENTKVYKRLYDGLDRLLLDVPCSGLGVLRRMPDTKWKLSPDELDRLAVLQGEILERYSPMVKPGGSIVYATCSVLPSENSGRIQAFLQNSEGKYSLESEVFVSPVETTFDGFYGARLVREK